MRIGKGLTFSRWVLTNGSPGFGGQFESWTQARSEWAHGTQGGGVNGSPGVLVPPGGWGRLLLRERQLAVSRGQLAFAVQRQVQRQERAICSFFLSFRGCMGIASGDQGDAGTVTGYGAGAAMTERAGPVLTRPSAGVACSSAWLYLAADKPRNQSSTETGLDAVDAVGALATGRQLVQAIGCICLSSLRNAKGDGCSVGVLIEIFSRRRRIKAQATHRPTANANNGEAVGRAQKKEKKGHFQRPQLSRAPRQNWPSFRSIANSTVEAARYRAGAIRPAHTVAITKLSQSHRRLLSEAASRRLQPHRPNWPAKTALGLASPMPFSPALTAVELSRRQSAIEHGRYRSLGSHSRSWP
ncbi:hypothetical protein EDB80DRAFT_840448 [Ilyonectria destructans]|nr:hypothetical protein EDB80DRAFT_840448 [Ilyonectria destructans]